jgi:transcriptional regulator with XRE-family HTH domain
MSTEDQVFFQKLGERITAFRKELGLTQAQLGERLGQAQVRILSFEKGRRRMPVSLLPGLAKALGVSLEELMGVQVGPSKPGPSSKLQQQLERLAKLPRREQRVVSQMIDGVLQQAGV